MPEPHESTGAREAFEALVGDLDYPMLIVTASAGDDRAGCLVGFATQSSIDPPRFVVCLSNKNRTFRIAGEAEVLVVHFVPADAGDLAELFGGETGDRLDKFAACEWRPGPGGAPVLARCENWFAGRIVERVVLGDHTGFVLEPVDAHVGEGFEEFTFHRAKRIEAGHEA
jgi:flavin reductase (DIM6/NTAB) family NADH-FMN oxidoreductase RutF